MPLWMRDSLSGFCFFHLEIHAETQRRRENCPPLSKVHVLRSNKRSLAALGISAAGSHYAHARKAPQLETSSLRLCAPMVSTSFARNCSTPQKVCVTVKMASIYSRGTHP